jgi:hypothetical protein
MLVPYGEIGEAQEQRTDGAVAEPNAPYPAAEAPLISPRAERFRMRHPDRPITRRWNFDFYLGDVHLHAVCGEVVVAADSADILEQAGWLRIRSE